MAGNWAASFGGRLARGALLALAGLAALVLAYLGAALIGTLLPVNSDWSPPESGVRVYVIDNGMHTDLVLPRRAAGVDWGDLLDPKDLRDPRHAARSHVAFGWGDRGFYVNTASFWNMRPDRAVSALLGLGPTVVHAASMREPVAQGPVHAVTLRPDEYRRLAEFVRDSFDLRDGAWKRPGYGLADAFYASRGRYSAYSTCNEWTAAALRAAGVRMGAWTPFAASVVLWL